MDFQVSSIVDALYSPPKKRDTKKVLPHYALKGTERGVPIHILDMEIEIEIGKVETCGV